MSRLDKYSDSKDFPGRERTALTASLNTHRSFLFVEKDSSDVFRHGIKHHLHDCFCRCDVIGQEPFSGHTDCSV